MSADVLELPFDQYQRYRLVSDLLNELRAKGERFSILDVGGRTALLRRFLEPDAITLVDLEAAPTPGLVLGDGSALPFASKSFDVVAAFDTLEHVPPARRAAFVAECARVARRWVVIAGPYAAPEVEMAEVLLQRFLRDKLGVEHRYLEEHRHNGLPSRPEVEGALAAAGARVTAIGHGNVERWLALMCAALYLDHEPALRPLAASIFRFYNANLYASDHARPVYRHAVVAAFDGARLPDGARGLEAPRAPAGMLERFQDVFAEMAAFDRGRGEWRVEREHLWDTVATLSSDLAGHRETLREARDLGRQSAEVIATLQADLAQHKTALAARSGEVDLLRSEVAHVQAHSAGEIARLRAAFDDAARERDASRAENARLQNELDRTRDAALAGERDLAGHRQVVAELRREVGTLRAALAGLESDRETVRAELTRVRNEAEAARAMLAACEADLAARKTLLEEHRGAVRELTEELAGRRAELAAVERAHAEARAELARLGQTLQAHDAKITELRGLVHGRLKNLRRALGPSRPVP